MQAEKSIYAFPLVPENCRLASHDKANTATVDVQTLWPCAVLLYQKIPDNIQMVHESKQQPRLQVTCSSVTIEHVIRNYYMC